jgi:hypothetical protein
MDKGQPGSVSCLSQGGSSRLKEREGDFRKIAVFTLSNSNQPQTVFFFSFQVAEIYFMFRRALAQI